MTTTKAAVKLARSNIGDAIEQVMLRDGRVTLVSDAVRQFEEAVRADERHEYRLDNWGKEVM